MLAGEVLWESWGSREENRDETMASIFSSRQTRFVLAVRWVGSPCKSLLLLRVKYIYVAHLHPPFLAETCSPVCVVQWQHFPRRQPVASITSLILLMLLLLREKQEITCTTAVVLWDLRRPHSFSYSISSTSQYHMLEGHAHHYGGVGWPTARV